MSCNSNQFAGNYQDDGCIKSVVKRIVKAQRIAVDAENDSCGTSCERSLEDLLSPVLEARPRRRHTTIPFMLICKHTCKPFVGTGITSRDHHNHDHDQNRNRHGHFECVESPIFRVRGYSGKSDNCVKLELLLPAYHRRGNEGADCSDNVGGNKHGDHSHGKDCCGGSVCDHFSGKHIHNFRETGICITVDLDCFGGITCLDPVTPIRLQD